jgi:hypothetical protein
MLIVLIGAFSFQSGVAHAFVSGEVTACNAAPNAQCMTLTYQDSTGATHDLTDSNGVPLASEHIMSGDVLTVHGTHWDPSSPFQVWLSVPFSTPSQEPDHNECYIRVDASAFPNADGSFTRSIAMPPIDDSLYPNGALFTIETGSRGIGCIASDRPANQAILDQENNAFETQFTAYPKPPAAACSIQQNNPCLTVSPTVVYPGEPVTVTGEGWKGASASLYVDPTATADCTTAVATATVTGGVFSATFIAPPLPTLPPSSANSGSLPVQFHVLAVAPSPSGGVCGSAGETQTAFLYVSQPTVSVTNAVHGGDTVTITGNHWAQSGGANSTATQPVHLAVLVGSNSSFNCSKAKVYTTTSNVTDPNTGSFTVSYTAGTVSANTVEQVRVIALPAGASAATYCANADPSAAACQTAQTGSGTCPLLAETTTFTIEPVAVAQINWLYILLPLALLLLLLPLAFFLGRRAEEEIIVTDEDVTAERDVIDATGSQRVAESTYARTIVETRERVRLRDGKILDQERAEYDVYRDAQGREVKRLRTPQARANQAPSTGSAGATSA